MKALTFKGGLHPNDHKGDTKDCAVIDLKASEIMVFPLSQHIGAPCEPTVEVGQKVFAGEKIGEAGSTGRSTGSHLHFEVEIGGRKIDPMECFEF